MLPDKDSFYENFPKFTFEGLQCVDGVVTSNVKKDAKLLSLQSPDAFIKLYSRIREGWTIDQCWELWCDVGSSWTLDKWGYWRDWNPPPTTWWCQPTSGQRLHIRNGKVERMAGGSDGARVIPDRQFSRQFKHLEPGVTLEQARVYLSEGSYRSNSCKQIYYFKPKTRRKDAPMTRTRMDRETRSAKLPPFLSTGYADVRIFHKGGSVEAPVDYVQVCLFALTRIWTDGSRTHVRQEVKENVDAYFTYAWKCLCGNLFFRQHPDYLKRFKPGRMRVTKDCCVEVDFNVS